MSPPFPKDAALEHSPISITSSDSVPDQPSVPLSSLSVEKFLEVELATQVLDELSPNLWMISLQTSDNIDPLHKQIIRGHKVVITEGPKLHLVWFRDFIYIKPIPICLLNYSFWEIFLREIFVGSSAVSPQTISNPPPSVRETTLGFLRSYAFLIRHRSDLQIALSVGLLPADTIWEGISKFLAAFRSVQDSAVSPRYSYGQLRLTRLNWLRRILRPKSSDSRWYYHRTTWNTAQYLEALFGPLLFAFASVATVLAAMQVALAIPVEVIKAAGFEAFQEATWMFAIATIIVIFVVWVAITLTPGLVLLSQFLYGLKRRVVGPKNKEGKV